MKLSFKNNHTNEEVTSESECYCVVVLLDLSATAKKWGFHAKAHASRAPGFEPSSRTLMTRVRCTNEDIKSAHTQERVIYCVHDFVNMLVKAHENFDNTATANSRQRLA